MQCDCIGILAPMWGGKTQKLNELASRAVANDKSVIAIEPKINKRNSERELHKIATTYPVEMHDPQDLSEVLQRIMDKSIEVVVLDECHLWSLSEDEGAQFYDFFYELLHKTYVDIYFSSLVWNCYKKDREFPLISKLLPWCTDIIFLRANCDISSSQDKATYIFSLDAENKVGNDYTVVSPYFYRKARRSEQKSLAVPGKKWNRQERVKATIFVE
ncbi:hypothetical protein [Candidatus Uabimicrobium sp. HlEnr_7]|uniref:hypothetical protein n=1 Tax=Candidatus Uabimicrobium helgolandensis TaxID=3095367 RepID=UPI003557938B